MYKLQFINTFNQEVLREATYDTTIEINSMIMAFENASEIDEPTLIIDRNMKTWKAEYMFNKVVSEDHGTTYKVFFIVSPSTIQAK